MKKAVLFAAMTAASSASFAASNGIDLGVSTLGAGIGYTYGIDQYFGVRAGYNRFDFDHNEHENSTTYDAQLKFQSFELLGEWHPFAGTFAVQGGLVYNDNKVTGNAVATNGTVKINGNTYTGSDPNAHLETDLGHLSPYLGIGWQANPVASPGLSFNARLGVIWQNPHATITPSGVNDPNGTLASDVAQAESTINNNLSKYGKVWPVLGIGLSYAF